MMEMLKMLDLLTKKAIRVKEQEYYRGVFIKKCKENVDFKPNINNVYSEIF